MSKPPLHALQGFVATARLRQPVARGRVDAPHHQRAEPPDPRARGSARAAPVRAQSARGDADRRRPALVRSRRRSPRCDRTRAAPLRHAPRRRADADPDAVLRDQLAGAAPAALPRRASATGDPPAVDDQRRRLRARCRTRCRPALRPRALAGAGSGAPVRRLAHADGEPRADRAPRAARRSKRSATFRCWARPAGAGPSGSSASAGRCRSVTWPTSTTPKRCTARRSKAWASCSAG